MYIIGLGTRAGAEHTSHTSRASTSDSAFASATADRVNTREVSSARDYATTSASALGGSYIPFRKKYIINCRSLTLHQKTRVLKLRLLPDEITLRDRQRKFPTCDSSRRGSSDCPVSRTSIDSSRSSLHTSRSLSHSSNLCASRNPSHSQQSGSPNSNASKSKSTCQVPEERSICAEVHADSKSIIGRTELFQVESSRPSDTPHSNCDSNNEQITFTVSSGEESSATLDTSTALSKPTPNCSKTQPNAFNNISTDSSPNPLAAGTRSESFSGQFITSSCSWTAIQPSAQLQTICPTPPVQPESAIAAADNFGVEAEAGRTSGSTLFWLAMFAGGGLSAQELLHQTAHCSACNERHLVQNLVDTILTQRAYVKPPKTVQQPSGFREDEAFTSTSNQQQQQSGQDEQQEFDLDDWRPVQLFQSNNSSGMRRTTTSKSPAKRSLVPRAYTAAFRRPSEAIAGSGGEEQWSYRPSYGTLRLRERYPHLTPSDSDDPVPVSNSLNRVPMGIRGKSLLEQYSPSTAGADCELNPDGSAKTPCPNCLLSRRQQLKLRLVGTLGAIPGHIGLPRNRSMPPTSSCGCRASADELHRSPNPNDPLFANDVADRDRSNSTTITFCSEMRRKLCMCLQREGTVTGGGGLLNGYESDAQRAAFGIKVEDLLRSGETNASLDPRRSLEVASIKQSLGAVFPYRVSSSTMRATPSAQTGGTRASQQGVRETLSLQLQLQKGKENASPSPGFGSDQQLRHADGHSEASNTSASQEATFAPPPTPTDSPPPNSRAESNKTRVAVERYMTRERSILRVRGLFPRASDPASGQQQLQLPQLQQSNPIPNSNISSTRSTPACAPATAPAPATAGVREPSSMNTTRLTPLKRKQMSGLRAHTAVVAAAAQRGAKGGVWDWRAQQLHEHQSLSPSNPQCPCAQCRSHVTHHTSRTGAGGLQLPVAFGSQDCRAFASIARAVAEERRYASVNHVNGDGSSSRIPQPQLVLEGISPHSK